MKSWTLPTPEMIEKALTSVKKEIDRQYFFSRLKNPLWINPLSERGYFKNPPGRKELPDGYVQYPHWPELSYLETITEDAPDEVIAILLALPKTDNPRVYDTILAIARKLQGENSTKLITKLLEYVDLGDTFSAHQYPELLKHWCEQGNTSEALKIAKLLVDFNEDPRTKYKQQLRKNEPESTGTLLQPTPRFPQWEYQQILEKGILPLAEKKPYEVSCMLVDAVANMIQLGMHHKDLERESDQDYSEIWCRRLDKPDRDYQEVRETLVQTLTHACRLVYEQAPGNIEALDKKLRSHRWRVLKRLRRYLYASHPNNQTLPKIREEIIGHTDYDKWEHDFEFQLMIHSACEHFGSRLLSVPELKLILDSICNGPSKEDVHAWLGNRYSADAFLQHQRSFHYLQLRPFAALLNGELRSYFYELEARVEPEVASDDSYLSYNEVTGGIVSYRSPKSTTELEAFTDGEILNYINDWSEEHRDRSNWLVEINISALADVFRILFKEQIVRDKQRLNFWLEKRNEITRPVYVSSMMRTMTELIEQKNLDNLEHWFDFSAWILSHPDTTKIEENPISQDESRDNPNWGNSRRAVVEFINACVNKNNEVKIDARASLASLLSLVSSQFDYRLDRDQPILLNRDDPIAEAINNTRSRALESLIRFGFWVRSQLPDDQLPEVTEILSKRLSEKAEIPLTRPEHALVGMHFGDLCILNRTWASQQREIVFKRSDESLWLNAFGSYIEHSNPRMLTFDVLRDEFEYAINNLQLLIGENGSNTNRVDKLGQHLFAYYLWGKYPLTGNTSLLESFYEKTKLDVKIWGRLFNYVGSSLRNSGKQMDIILIDRIVVFFNWRFSIAEPLELSEFTFWLESECLSAEWRLQSFSKLLNFAHEKDTGLYRQVRALNKLLPNHLALVVECFAKITDTLDQSKQMYISTDEAKPILKAGLECDIPQIIEFARQARESLLRLGRFDYLDLE